MNLIILNNRTVSFEKIGKDFLLEECPVRLLKDFLIIRETPTQYSKGIFYHYKDNSFRIGLLPYVIKFLSLNNISYVLYDNRVQELTYKGVFELDGFKYEPWQQRALEKANYSINGAPFYRGIFDYATNSGKSLIIASLYKSFDKPMTLVLIHRVEIFNQLKGLLETQFGNIGIINSRVLKIGNITLAMEKSLINKRTNIEVMALLENVQLLILDECHIGKGIQLYKLLSSIDVEACYFFSGTPLAFDSMNDKLKILGLSGKVLDKVTNKQLMEAGKSREVSLHIHKIPYEHIVKNYKISYEYNIIRSKLRNSIIADICKSGQIIIGVTLVNHGEYLKDYLESAGIRSTLFTSKSKDRKELDKFKEGRVRVLICTTVIKEGVNINNIDKMINAAGGKSEVFVKQMLIGRSVRLKEGSKTVELHDFYDCAFPEHSEIRKEIYSSEL